MICKVHKHQKKGFPKWLTFLVWSTIPVRSFVTWDGKSIAPVEFAVNEELQQSTVNSPILFNVLLSDLSSLFGFNEQGNTGLLAFANELKLSKISWTPLLTKSTDTMPPGTSNLTRGSTH